MKSLALAVLLFSAAAIEVSTSRIADGTTQTFLSGSRKVAVHKSGDTTTVMVEEGDRLDTITLTRAGGQLTIGRKDNGVARRFLVLDRPKIIVDGIDLEPQLMDPMMGLDPKVAARGDAPMPAPRDGSYEAVPMPMVPETPRGLKPAPMPIPNPEAPKPNTRYYVCPKDATVVMTPQPSADGKIRCPLDGTEMKAHVGRGSKFFLID